MRTEHWYQEGEYCKNYECYNAKYLFFVVLIIMEQVYNLVKNYLGDDYLKAYDEIETI